MSKHKHIVGQPLPTALHILSVRLRIKTEGKVSSACRLSWSFIETALNIYKQYQYSECAHTARNLLDELIGGLRTTTERRRQDSVLTDIFVVSDQIRSGAIKEMLIKNIGF